MVEHMREGLARERHRETVGVGEVRQRLTAGRMLLTEDQLPFRAFCRPPVSQAPLQRAQHPVRIATRMKALQLLQNRRRPDRRNLLQERHDLRAPNVVERIDTCPILPGRALARQDRRRLPTTRRALAETRSQSRCGLCVSRLA